MRLGQEFGGYAATLRAFLPRLAQAAHDIGTIGIGGSAAGTGLNVHPKYRAMMVEEFRTHLGFDVRRSDNYFASMQGHHDSVFLSGVVAGLAIELGRIANTYSQETPNNSNKDLSSLKKISKQFNILNMASNYSKKLATGKQTMIMPQPPHYGKSVTINLSLQSCNGVFPCQLLPLF